MCCTLKATWMQRGFCMHEEAIFQQAEINLPNISGCGRECEIKPKHSTDSQSKSHSTASATTIYSGLLEVLETACCFRAMEAVLLRRGRGGTQAETAFLPIFPGTGRGPHGCPAAPPPYCVLTGAQIRRGH